MRISESKWERWFGNYESKIPRAEKNDPKCKHLDRCGGWKGKDSAKISFHIPRLTKGNLLLSFNKLFKHEK